MLSLSFRLEPDDDHDDALSERATTTDDNDDVVDSSSLFFLCFDASVLKNENNIRELTYDDHCSDRHNSRSLMLLAFFSSDASKQKNTTSNYEFLNKHRIIRTKLTCRRLFLLVISWLFRSAIMRESLSKWPPSNADMCIWPVLGFTGARSALEGGGANNDRRGYKLALQ